MMLFKSQPTTDSWDNVLKQLHTIISSHEMIILDQIDQKREGLA
ncbi:hypothetical protein IC582_027213 [Cucumis melo]